MSNNHVSDSEAKQGGFTIDDTVYPHVAYKGDRNEPTVWIYCYPDEEFNPPMTDKVKKAIEEITNYMWEDERRDFEEMIDLAPSQDDFEEWIEWCDKHKELVNNHIFYHLMILKQSIS